MAITGNVAYASDFNTLREEINDWFRDPNPSMTFGDGQQTYGWGGDAISAVSTGQKMTALSMNGVVDRCNIGTNICNGVTGSLSQVVPGTSIDAADINLIISKSSSISGQRNDIDPTVMSLGGGGFDTNAAPVWAVPIDGAYAFTQASFAKSRYFFNSGGAIYFSGTIAGYSTGSGWDGQGFNEIFTNMGTIIMDYNQTIQTGSGGTPTSIGFYDLTTSWQTIFTQTGTGAYTNASLLLQARYQSSGAVTQIRVVLTPEAGRSVDGITTITMQHRKLDNQTSGSQSLTITAPVWSQVNPL
jgi:hypothetical protein